MPCFCLHRVDSDTGAVMMSRSAGQGDHRLQFRVYDNVRDVEAICTMNINAVYLTDDMLEHSASFRLSGKITLY